jgi:competence protein ComEC
VGGLFIGVILLLGGLAVWRVDRVTPPELFGKRAFEAKVISVDRRLDRTLVIVRESQYQQKIQGSIPGISELLPGDTVSMRGDVVVPEDFVTNNGRMFGYQSYLASKDIVGIVNNAQVVLIKQGHFSLSRFATTLRYSVADIFAQYISFPFDGVMAGMLVGYQGGLPASIQDLFRNTGVLHVLVLSGYNITLLAGFLGIVLQRLPFRVKSIVTIVAIILLVLVSGAGVASVRAGIMGGIAVFAGLAVRTYQPVRALSIAYCVFFLINPMIIFVDPGFHLSFLATFFMIILLPKIENLFAFIPQTQHIDLRELIMLALTVPIFMLPYMMYFSGMFPLASPFANMLFTIVTPAIMVGGIILVVLAWLVPFAMLISTVISIFGKFLLGLLGILSQLPIWNTLSLAWWGVDSFYIILTFLFFRREISEYFLQYYTVLRRKTN